MIDKYKEIRDRINELQEDDRNHIYHNPYMIDLEFTTLFKKQGLTTDFTDDEQHNKIIHQIAELVFNFTGY